MKACFASATKQFCQKYADYELRRELIRKPSSKALLKLNMLGHELIYLPIDTSSLRRAAELWAQARNRGRPFTDDHALEGDVILCAQAQMLAQFYPNSEVVIATNHEVVSSSLTGQAY